MELVFLILAVVVIFGVLYIATKRAQMSSNIEHTACGTPECCGTCDTETVTITEVAAVAASGNVSTTTNTDLTAMKKDALLAYAKEKGIKVSSSMTKQALIEAINAG